MAMSEVGTSHHMAGLALESYGGLKIKFVNIKAFGEQLQQVMGSHVDGALWPSGEAAKQIEAGVVRPLAISSNGRFKQFPDLPTWKEVGLNIDEFATISRLGRAEGDPGCGRRLSRRTAGQITSDPDVIAKMSAAGYKPLVYDGRKGFDKSLKNYDEMTTKIMKSAGLGKK